MMKLGLLILLCLFVIVTKSQNCIVTIGNGTINGKSTDTLDPSRKVCSYLGIPFATPPVGSLRFEPPQPAQSFGNLNATRHPNWCPQGSAPPLGITMSEDCLYLNVYHPEVDDISNSSFPVMIWIHGGGFISSDSLPYYTPSRLLSRDDIVLVVVQYRLGLLGLLSTGDEVVLGNNALKDQAMSIRWVNENIRAFGGNPEQVTLFGESGGALSVIYQLLSPVNKGLFHGVIAQSMPDLGQSDKTPEQSAKLMGARLNCTTTSNSEMINCLRERTWEEIIQKQTEYIVESYQNNKIPSATILPVVEPDLPGAFLAEEPLEVIRNGEDWNTSIPVIIGATKHEGSFMLATLYVTRIGPLGLDKDPDHMREQVVPDILSYFGIQGDSVNRGVASSLEIAYLPGVNRSSWNESMPGLVDIMSVFYFKSSILATTELLSKRGSKVYLYSFDHHSHNSIFPMTFGTDLPIEIGISHGDDMIYLFDFPSNFTAADQAFSEMLSDLWINFGKFGNPTPVPSERYDQWPTYDLVDGPYMKLNGTPSVQFDYRASWFPSGFEWD